MLVKTLPVLHVSAGAVALLGMGAALLTRKGSERHRLGGRFCSAAIRDRAVRGLDRMALGGFLACALAVFGFAAVVFAQREGLAPVPVVFGLLSLGLPRADWQRRRGWPSGIDGVALHLSRMGGATIATPHVRK